MSESRDTPENDPQTGDPTGQPQQGSAGSPDDVAGISPDDAANASTGDSPSASNAVSADVASNVPELSSPQPSSGERSTEAAEPSSAAAEPAKGRWGKQGKKPKKLREPEPVQSLRKADPDEDIGIPIEREELMMLHEPRGQVAEQFRGLRNSIHALNPDAASHTLVLASALRGEGKTIACLNLALAMAEMPSMEVLIVDADLHHPAVENYLGLERRQGLTEVLSGKLNLDRSIRRTSVSGLSVMGAGDLPRNPSELIGSDRMRTLLNRLKQRYSYVLVDTPQAMTISDASLIGAMVDGVLLVVRLGETPRHYVEQTYNQIEALGGNILGTCLTGAKLADTSANYSRRE
ncbi:MAG: capsular exopolysaccharide synthesis family protein [Planctomycetota bacterium]|jgi:capsular exopolysaccharide synthesis family protein